LAGRIFSLRHLILLNISLGNLIKPLNISKTKFESSNKFFFCFKTLCLIKTYVRWEDGEILGMILTNSASILIPLSETSNLRVEVSLLDSSKISTPLHVSAPVRSEVKVEDGSNLGPAVHCVIQQD